LSKQKLNARLVPHALIQDQKEVWASICADLLHEAFIKSITAEDETQSRNFMDKGPYSSRACYCHTVPAHSPVYTRWLIKEDCRTTHKNSAALYWNKKCCGHTEVLPCPFSNVMGAFIQNNSQTL
jgi:hypothetical protein